MKVHELKTWPEPFQAVWDDVKTAELRLNDRGFEVGHSLLLREYDPKTETYSGRYVCAWVTHILDGGFGLADGHVMMSFVVYEAGPDRPTHGWESVSSQILASHLTALQEAVLGERKANKAVADHVVDGPYAWMQSRELVSNRDQWSCRVIEALSNASSLLALRLRKSNA